MEPFRMKWSTSPSNAAFPQWPLGANPWPIIVPCHRVTGANGKLGGFSARGGAMTKLKLLEIEGAEAAAQAKADQATAVLKASKKTEASKQPRLF